VLFDLFVGTRAAGVVFFVELGSGARNQAQGRHSGRLVFSRFSAAIVADAFLPFFIFLFLIRRFGKIAGEPGFRGSSLPEGNGFRRGSTKIGRAVAGTDFVAVECRRRPMPLLPGVGGKGGR